MVVRVEKSSRVVSRRREREAVSARSSASRCQWKKTPEAKIAATESEAPERFKNPFGRSTRPIGAPPERETVAGVRRDTGAGVWRFRGGVVVDARSAVESRAGSSAVAPRTVLEHLQQREGRDLDVLRGVHLRGIPGGRLGSAPHHTPATHHAGDVHRTLFTCTWPCTAKWSCARKTRSVTSVARSIGTRFVGDRFRPFAARLQNFSKSAVSCARKVNASAPVVLPRGPVRAVLRERVWQSSRCRDALASARSSRTWVPQRVRCGRNTPVSADRNFAAPFRDSRNVDSTDRFPRPTPCPRERRMSAASASFASTARRCGTPRRTANPRAGSAGPLWSQARMRKPDACSALPTSLPTPRRTSKRRGAKCARPPSRRASTPARKAPPC